MNGKNTISHFPRTSLHFYALLYFHALPRTSTHFRALPRTSTHFHAFPRGATSCHVMPSHCHVMPRSVVCRHALPRHRHDSLKIFDVFHSFFIHLLSPAHHTAQTHTNNALQALTYTFSTLDISNNGYWQNVTLS
jgi:hypothetical protein